MKDRGCRHPKRVYVCWSIVAQLTIESSFIVISDLAYGPHQSRRYPFFPWPLNMLPHIMHPHKIKSFGSTLILSDISMSRTISLARSFTSFGKSVVLLRHIVKLVVTVAAVPFLKF
jgi:hypothetical protein